MDASITGIEKFCKVVVGRYTIAPVSHIEPLPHSL